MKWHKAAKPPKAVTRTRTLNRNVAYKTFYESDLIAIRHHFKGEYPSTTLGYYRIDHNYENGHYVDQDGEPIEYPYEWDLVGEFNPRR